MRTIRMTTAVTLAALVATLLVSAPASAADLAVSGTVALDGTPRAGVAVGWFEPATELSGETLSGADGSFSLPVAAGHPYVLYAGNNYADRHWKRQSDGVVGVFVGANGQDYLYQTRRLFPAVTAPIAGVSLDLDLPGAITGTAKNLNGVEVSRTNGQVIDCDCNPKTETFLVGNLIPGKYRVRALQDKPKHDLEEWKSGIITVAAGQTVTVKPDFSDDAGTLTGILTSNNKPLKGQDVYAYRDNTGGSDTTDSKGRYTITDLPAGKYNVGFGNGVGYGEKSKYVAEQATVTIRDGKKSRLDRDIETGTVLKGFITGIAEQYVRVTVLDQGGTVVRGRTVIAKGATSTFHLNGVPAGTHRIVFSDGKKYAIVAARFAGGTTSIGTVALSTPTITLMGTLAGSSKGEIHYTIGDRSETGDEVDFPLRSYAVVKNGKFSVPGVVPGLATFDVHVANRTMSTTTFTVGSNPIRLTPGTKWEKITGKLTLAGKPLGHTYGNATNSANPYGLGGFEQKAGKFSGRVAPATVKLSISYNGQWPYFVDDSPYWFDIPKSKAKVTVKSGKTLDVGTIEVVVKGRG